MKTVVTRNIKKNALLVKKITAVLEEGIVITGEVAHFIETTFGRLNADSLARILSDPENAEAESLVELLLYPDETLQVQIEKLLEKNEYSDSDIDKVIAGLGPHPMPVSLRLPGAKEDDAWEFIIHAPVSAIATLIERLNITRRIEPRMANILARRLADQSEIQKARVKLRNARFAFTETATGFLCELIEKTYQNPALFRQVFIFIIDFLDETNQRTDIYSALMDKKRSLHNMIRQATTIKKALRENPPEVLMMKGNPILSINIDDARRLMDLIDRICVLMFGATDASIKSDPVALSAAFKGVDDI